MLGTLQGIQSAFAEPCFGASANYGIGSDGTIYQFVNDENTAWANGPIREPNLAAVPWIATLAPQKINPNSLTISIEWAGSHHGMTWTTTEFQGHRLDTIARGGIQQPWVPPEVQYAAGRALIAELCQKWGIPADREHICRHSDFDTVTKWFCPGAGFPMSRLLQDLAGLPAALDIGPAPIAGPAPDAAAERDEHARSIGAAHR